VSNLPEKDRDADTVKRAFRARKGCRYVQNILETPKRKKEFKVSRVNCNRKQSFICKKPDFYAAKGESKPKVFRVSEAKLAHAPAEAYCNEWGGNLVKIVGGW